MRVVWSTPASRQLERLGEYIRQHNPNAAGVTVRRIFSRSQLLSRHPRMGRPGEIADAREFVVPGTPYIIFYSLQPDRIEILSVIHGARRRPEAL